MGGILTYNIKREGIKRKQNWAKDGILFKSWRSFQRSYLYTGKQ
jgi:hypothetical protein